MTDFSLEFVFASGEKHSPKAEPNEWLLRSDADTVADSLTVRFSAGKRLFTEEPVGAVLKKDGAGGDFLPVQNAERRYGAKRADGRIQRGISRSFGPTGARAVSFRLCENSTDGAFK